MTGKRNTNGSTGRLGEDIACSYLAGIGHTILERNWRYGHLEIDIITFDHSGIHFVEVKTRVAPVLAEPEECVGPAKQKRIAEAAAKYLASPRKGRPEDMECKFDIIAVTIGPDSTDVRYYPEAYVPVFL